MAILSNMQGRDIHLVLKSRAHFYDKLGSPDHGSKPPDIKIRGHFRATFAKENVPVLNTKLLVFQIACTLKICRQTVDSEGWRGEVTALINGNQ